MPTSFTVHFICHGDLALLERVIPQNLRAICENTVETYDVILTVDGAETEKCPSFLYAASRWGIDEIRFRWRDRNCATGDPSNNGHLHAISEKTPYLLTLEGDVALFRTDREFDVLNAFRRLFERHEQLALATRMDDHDCWVWKLEDVGAPFEAGVRSVNRVASHFLVYETARFRRFLSRRIRLSPTVFHDRSDDYFNYEDLLSDVFARPTGPGIAFVESFPIQVYHCDRKVEANSVFYSKELRIKLAEFERRRAEVGIASE